MALTANITGTIEIGAIKVPISTKVPPDHPGTFVFDYTAADPTKPDTVIAVGDFISWAATNLGLTAAKTDLPTSLQNLSVAIFSLHLDTTGVVKITVEVGTKTGETWSSTWTPIDALSSFKLNALTLSVDREP